MTPEARKRAKEMLRLRGQGRTLRAIGDEFDVGPERVRQLLAQLERSSRPPAWTRTHKRFVPLFSLSDFHLALRLSSRLSEIDDERRRLLALVLVDGHSVDQLLTKAEYAEISASSFLRDVRELVRELFPEVGEVGRYDHARFWGNRFWGNSLGNCP